MSASWQQESSWRLTSRQPPLSLEQRLKMTQLWKGLQGWLLSQLLGQSQQQQQQQQH